MGSPSLHVRSGHPSFLDLQWEMSISEWDSGPLVTMPTGVHRHPVVFVSYPEGVYAIKELPVRYARREYEALLALEERGTSSAKAVGLIQRDWLDDHAEASAAVVTKYVDYAFPYRELVEGEGFGARRVNVRDALASLLVELHLAGCFWGDCSLSNALYRYDAGSIDAVMIDAETSSLHDTLSRGQREHDLEIMIENVSGAMADIAVSQGSTVDRADLEFGQDTAIQYRVLWDELSSDLVVATGESYRIRERIARLNDLGFSVDEVDIEPVGEGNLVRMRAKVGGRSFHTQRLQEMTGVVATENQAREILSDINYYLSKVENVSSPSLKAVGVVKWRLNAFEPLMFEIGQIYDGDPIQGFCDLLRHRVGIASGRGQDVPNQEALSLWIEAGMPGYPVEVTSSRSETVNDLSTDNGSEQLERVVEDHEVGQ